jgi:alpha-galactosidase
MSKLIGFLSVFLIIFFINNSFSQVKEILTSEKLPEKAIRLESLNLKNLNQEWGSPQEGKSVDHNQIKLKGVTYPHGLGTHAHSELLIDLKGKGKRFISMIGVDDEVNNHGSVQFEIWLDEKQVFKSGILKGNSEPELVDIDLTDAKIMNLIVNDGGDNINYDHADWAGALIYLLPGATEKPNTINVIDESTPEIYIGQYPGISINGASVIGTTPNKPFIFLISLSGKVPIKLTVENLPDGLSFNLETGIISGSVQKEGKYIIPVTAENNEGKISKNLTIIAGRNKLAQTPPMGWNSWNVWGLEVNDKRVRDAADWMVKSGLAAHGFQYINIDDGWELDRDKDGKIRTNDKFPDMKSLSDYVHSKGLKLGIYSSPGPKTCGGFLGSYEHELQDAKTYAEWGIDYLKYDWCSYGEKAKDRSHI